MLNLKPHEEAFEIKPTGIRYRCEFCNEGEMKHLNNEPIVVNLSEDAPRMYNHVCDKCGKIMMLPKVYPYIEWTSVDN